MTCTCCHASTAQQKGFALFASGFRPFFLAAAAVAVANMLVWLAAYISPALWPEEEIAAVWWHAHEMLFGFVSAAVGGFLLTAVPNWTGRAPYGGRILYLLVASWLAGRLALAPLGLFSATARAVIDLSFYPLLALTLAPALIRAGKLRNLAFLALLTLLTGCNLLFHLGAGGIVPAGEHIGLALALDIVTLMIVIIGGRILPAFTRNALLQHGLDPGIEIDPWIERLALFGILAMAVADMTMPMTRLDGGFTLLAGVTQVLRMSQWKSQRTLGMPLLWILHLGYGWLVLGLLLKAVWLLFALPLAANWIHAFTAGAIGTMILAVMSRASLGHSGRALVAPPLVAAAFVIVNLAAAIRVFGPVLLPDHYQHVILAAGILWVLAFAVFLAVYLPIFLAPRLDGKPG
jgi:uncharacterized protein involved in response to NO